MLRFGCRASNLVASRRAQTVRDFPSCADIDLDLACFRVERNGITRLITEEEQSFLFRASRSGSTEPGWCYLSSVSVLVVEDYEPFRQYVCSTPGKRTECRSSVKSQTDWKRYKKPKNAVVLSRHLHRSPHGGSIAEIDRVCFIVSDVCVWNQFSVRREEHGLANG